jgi:FkbM family methyltransferase
MAFFDQFFDQLRDRWRDHAPAGDAYRRLQAEARSRVEAMFSGDAPEPRDFGPFGPLVFPYFAMGSIDSLNLFNLDELILFSFYWANRAHYRRVVDFGANLGLHSVILVRCGYEVRSFEPDPIHFARLRQNLAWNRATSAELHNSAVSAEDGVHEFVRVLGNTTGSHLAGSKRDPYGELERFSVRVESAAPHLAWADLAKIDIEGHEKDLLLGIEPSVWKTTDAMAEVGSEENADAIWHAFRDSGVHLFAQKTGWQRVTRFADMPTSHRDGSLFVTVKPAVPW